MEETNEEYV